MANKIIGIMKYSRAARLSKPNEKTSEKKIYAVAQSDETINLNHLATHMAEHTSPFSVGTIKGVLADAVGCIVELLCQGKRVQLEGLGTFFTSLKSTGADSTEAFTAANITAVVPHIAFDKATWDGMRSKAAVAMMSVFFFAFLHFCILHFMVLYTKFISCYAIFFVPLHSDKNNLNND